MTRAFCFNQGLTLLECLFVTVIVAVLSTIAFPSYKSMIAVSRISTATSELHGALLYSRSEALKRGGQVVICRSSNTLSENPSCDAGSSSSNLGWAAGWLIFHDRDKNQRFTNGDELLQAHGKLFADPREGRISTSPNRNQITFNATGQTFANYMRFVVHRPEHDTEAKHDRYVCLASGGRARVSEEACR